MISYPLEQYRAIFFDAGDTLLTIPEAHNICRAYLESQAFHRDEEHISEVLHEAIRLFYYEKKNELYEACTPESDRRFWVELYTFAMGRLGANEQFSAERIHKISHDLYDIFVDPVHYHLFEDVEESLLALKEKGFRLGIISNFAPTLTRILEQKGILHYFDPVIVSTEVGLEKPNPQIFQLALEQSGLLAEEVLYVGDHDINDIWAPAQIGMNAVKIRRYSYMTGEGINSLHELLHENR